LLALEKARKRKSTMLRNEVDFDMIDERSIIFSENISKIEDPDH